MFDRVVQQFNRVQSIPLHELLVELLIIWVLVYLAFRFLRGTRGAGVIKGIVLMLIVATLVMRVLGREASFNRLTFLYNSMVGFIAFALLIIFQPELRRGFVRLGETRFFRGGGLRKARVVEELISAVVYLSRNKIGALIALEQSVGLRGIIESGTRLDSIVSKELLSTIFWPGSALHDMGVVISGDRIIAAGVQFPLADADQVPSGLGSRHRSAIGLSQDSDAIIIVVSEETGIISIAEHGELSRHLTIDDLRSRLVQSVVKPLLTVNDNNGNDSEESSRTTRE